MRNRYLRSSIMAAVSAALAGTALADNNETGSAVSDTELQEIVITAQKRPEKLEDAAVAASVVSSDQISNLNAGDISDLNRLVPSVELNGSINGRVPLGIRGISSVSNEGTVGLSSGVNIMIDGVSIPSDSRAGNALEDVQSIEVLKGPQNTLGGRTAATGEINIVTRQPTDEFEGSITGMGTTDSEYRANGYVSGPITQGIDFSLAGYYTERQFPIVNIQLDRHTKEEIEGLRAKLLFKPTDDLDIKLSARVGKDDSTGFNFVYTYATPGVDLLCGVACPPYYPTQAQLLGVTPSTTNRYYSSPVNVYSDVEDRDFGLDIQYRIGGLTLASTTAYQYEHQINEQDLFAVSQYFFNVLTQGHAPPFYNVQTQFLKLDTFSEELKLVSPTDQPLSYLVGLFYSDSRVNQFSLRELAPALTNATVEPVTKTSDVYCRLTWKFTPDTALILGLRYNHDQISYTYDQFSPPAMAASGSSSEGTPVGDITLQQHFTPQLMAYATYSRGYSPAAYNTSQQLSSAEPVLGRAKKENINNFEIGTKGTYLDGRATVNVALFDTKYQDFQVQIFDQSNVAVSPPLILTNAGGAETRGIELDTAFAATRLLRLDFNAAYIDATFTDYNGAPCYYPTTAAGIGYNPAGCYQAQNGVQVTGPGQASVNAVPVVQNLGGKAMPNAPRLKFVFNAEQRIPLPSSLEMVLASNYTWRSHAQMLVDQNPYGIQGSFGILNLSAAIQDAAKKFTVTAFVNNVTNHFYYTDIEDFWSSPWGSSNMVIGQPARDARVYAGLRATWRF